MSGKKCGSCKHFAQYLPDGDFSNSGFCEYPVPAYLCRRAEAEVSFYEGSNCRVYEGLIACDSEVRESE